MSKWCGREKWHQLWEGFESTQNRSHGILRFGKCFERFPDLQRIPWLNRWDLHLLVRSYDLPVSWRSSCSWLLFTQYSLILMMRDKGEESGWPYRNGYWWWIVFGGWLKGNFFFFLHFTEVLEQLKFSQRKMKISRDNVKGFRVFYVVIKIFKKFMW